MELFNDTPAMGAETALRSAYPLILTLDTHGVPHRWISWQHACYYHAKDQVAWSLGEEAFTVFGGLNRATGERSSISSCSIIAIKGKAMAMKAFSQVPPLNNRELFHRDRQICAYCGGTFPISKLTRDHVVPFSRGGRDVWMNVVTACRSCNERKSDRTPERAGIIDVDEVEPDRRLAETNLPGARLADLDLLPAHLLGPAGLVNTDRLGH